MPSWTTGLLRPELLALALLTAVLAGALRLLRPLLQSALRPTWALLNLAWCAQVVALLAANQDHRLLVGIFRDGAHVLTVWACIQISTLLVFRVLLPALRVNLPQIAQDLTLTALSLAWDETRRRL